MGDYLPPSSKYSIIALNAHTEPAVNIPSQKITSVQCTSKKLLLNPPKTMDIKNPIHVDVHNVQLIKSPKNLECFFINVLVDSKIEPQTNMDVIPYAAKIQKINIIIYNVY